MTPRRWGACLAAVLLWATPAWAEDAPAPATPGDQARQGLDLLMKALEGWVRQVPLYAPPEVTPEGDIIIRRLDRSRPNPPSAGPPTAPDPRSPDPRSPGPRHSEPATPGGTAESPATDL